MTLRKAALSYIFWELATLMIRTNGLVPNQHKKNAYFNGCGSV